MAGGIPPYAALASRLRLRKQQDYFPDSSVYTDAGFKLQMRHGKLEPSAEHISVSVLCYAWAYPGAIAGLAIAP